MPTYPTDRIERLRQRAAKLEALAGDLQAEINRHRGDIAYHTQPAVPNSPFSKRRDRAWVRYRKGAQFLAEAEKLRAKADRWEQHGIPTKGDAEQGHQRMRDAIDAAVSKGDTAYSPLYGSGEVLRVNRKTLRVRFRMRTPSPLTGRDTYDMTLDKTLFTVLEDRPDEAP